ncbi:HisA/HisF-related TIM barrel protein [Candidatus Thioglobus sp.]|nr:HisA/HisF-related TIM barrel protein [Candidatus Thioglobus sp.]
MQKVGGIEWLEKNYKFKKIAFSLDELIVLNASKGEKKIFEFSKTLEKIVEDVFIPVAAGGGVRSVEDAELLFNSGADKIVINTILIEDSNLVRSLINKYGSQSIVASVDYRSDEVFIRNGTVKVDRKLKDYLKDVELLGVGEIYLNSIDKDGTGFGYDLIQVEESVKEIKIPIIIAGGAGNELHLSEGLDLECVSAVATANLFNFVGDSLEKTRNNLLGDDYSLAFWDTKFAKNLKG